MKSLRKNSDFQTVYKKRISRGNRYFVMYVIKNTESENRIGISVSKKVGNSVIRHKVKRRVKEVLRLHEKVSNSSLDIVIVARKGAGEIDYSQTESSILDLLKQHKIF